jgi:hypothetical protein
MAITVVPYSASTLGVIWEDAQTALLVKDPITGDWIYPLRGDGTVTIYASQDDGVTWSAVSSTFSMGNIFSCAIDSGGTLHTVIYSAGSREYHRFTLTRSGGHITGAADAGGVSFPAPSGQLGEFKVQQVFAAFNGSSAERLIFVGTDGDAGVWRTHVCHTPIPPTASTSFTSLSGTAGAWTMLTSHTQRGNTFAPYGFHSRALAYGSSGNIYVAAGPYGLSDQGDYGSPVYGQRLLASGANWTVDGTVDAVSADSFESLLGVGCTVNGAAYFPTSYRAADGNPCTLNVARVSATGVLTTSIIGTALTTSYGSEPMLAVHVTSTEKAILVSAVRQYDTGYPVTVYSWDGTSWTTTRGSLSGDGNSKQLMVCGISDSRIIFASSDYYASPANANYGYAYWPAETQIGGTMDFVGSGGAVVGGSAVVTSHASGAQWESAGTIAYSSSGGTSVAPAYPSGIQAGDALILFVHQKPSTANGGTVTTPSGWTLLGSLTGAGGYSSTLGADTGNTNVFVYYKTTVSGSETGTQSVTVGTNGVCSAQIHRISPNSSGSTWSYAMATGSRTTGSASTSITFGTDPGVAAKDLCVCYFGIPTDVTVPNQFSAEAFSQTGITWGTVTEANEPVTATGNDLGGVVCYAQAVSGTSSAAPVFSTTAGGTVTNVRGPAAFVRVREVSSGVTVSPGGIASGEAWGSPTVGTGAVAVSPGGISSSEAWGSATVSVGAVAVSPGGIASGEAWGTPSLAASIVVSPGGIASAEAWGTVALAASIAISPGGIASSEAWGTPSLAFPGATVSPTGIASGEAWGSPTLSSSITVGPTGIASAEAWGTPSLAGAGTISPAGIPSAEAWGTPSISTSIVLTASSIPSGEAWGSAVVSSGALVVAPTGIPSGEAWGTPAVSVGPVTVAPSGIASGEAWGAVAVQPTITVAPSGIASSEAWGSATVQPGATVLSPGGIPSGETWGAPVVTITGQVLVRPSSIASAEAWGSPTVQPGATVLTVYGIESEEAWGDVDVRPGGRMLAPSSIASGEAWGTPAVEPGPRVLSPASIESAEAWGTPTVDLTLGVVRVPSIESGEAWGTPSVSTGMVALELAGIPSAEAWGSPTLYVIAHNVYVPPERCIAIDCSVRTVSLEAS